MTSTLRKMKFFRKRDKSKGSLAAAGDNFTGPHAQADQHYGSYGGSRAEATFASPGTTTTSGRSRNFKGLGGFGSSGGGSGGGGGRNGSYGDRNRGVATSATRASVRALQALPDAVLARIFVFVCPHSEDRSFETCEASGGYGCMLCDMRDLAHCVQVCRRWRLVAEQILYASIRIDSVHYCEREAILAERRKRHSFFDRNGEPEDTPDARLKLLCRTLRDDPSQRLGRFVQFLKLPYMLRESHHADIARTTSVLPNLRYVDLPEGLFMDEPVYITLKLEIQAKCPDLRKMTYVGGAERSLEALASGSLWRNLEVLELVRIGMDPAMMRHVLASLPNLRALKIEEAAAGPHAFSDDVLATAQPQPPPSLQHPFSAGLQQAIFSADLPPLEELVLTNTRRLTAEGLLDYVSRPDTRRAMKVLTLNGTGVRPWSLQAVLAQALSLRHLTIVDEASAALPLAAGTRDIQPLASASLQTLNYEIKAAAAVSPYAGVTRSYYNYLSGSILSGGLPNLRAVYVRDAQFPDSLLGALPLPPPGPIGGGEFFGGGGSSNRRPASSGAVAAPGSLGPAQAPQGFLSPHHTPGPSSPPAARPWMANEQNNPRFSSNNPFAGMISPQQVQMLEVFTKGDDDLDWSSIVVSGDGGYGGGGGGGDFFFGGMAGHTVGGGGGGSGGTSSRPVSSYGLGADLGGAVGARKSVLVNTGTGSFLAVPDGSSSGRRSPGGNGTSAAAELWPRPMSSSGERRSEKRDLWR